MNRESRRKLVMKVATDALKGRDVAVKKKQFGFGLIVTNIMGVLVFARWTWTLWDRRK